MLGTARLRAVFVADLFMCPVVCWYRLGQVSFLKRFYSYMLVMVLRDLTVSVGTLILIGVQAVIACLLIELYILVFYKTAELFCGRLPDFYCFRLFIYRVFAPSVLAFP